MEVAIRTGFSDQSHFTNYFNQFTGLAPGIYHEIFPEKDGDGRQMEGKRGSDGKQEDSRAFGSSVYHTYMGNGLYIHQSPAGRFHASGNFVFPFCHGICSVVSGLSAPDENCGPQAGDNFRSGRAGFSSRRAFPFWVSWKGA